MDLTLGGLDFRRSGLRSEEVQPFLENEFPQATKVRAMSGPYLTSSA